MTHVDTDIYAKLREYIKRSGKTQRVVAEEAGIPNPSYLSHMVNGRINWVDSDYFRPLTEVLKLSVDEIAELKPDVIWSQPQPKPVREVDAADIDAPPELEAALVRAAQLYPVFNTEVARAYLTHMYNFDGIGPQTEDEWLDVALSLRPILERGPHGR